MTSQSVDLHIEDDLSPAEQLRALSRDGERTPKDQHREHREHRKHLANPYQEGKLIKAYYTKIKNNFLYHSCEEKNREAQARLKSLKLSPVRMRAWSRQVEQNSTDHGIQNYYRTREDFPNYFDASSVESAANPSPIQMKSRKLEAKMGNRY